ncbi:MAG: VWA domain-containing protein [Desulfarculus sp.]|nr:VWA domain-containing protein [Pseudomonadota bacterium]MBV1714925.1 VWA domain-containing protein [Desulfarculus sp.]MBU4576706.1 VWA domain-containing protein [Pseudomonadota bacterium]MBU4599022.1 VWA domain-containing protein [Pseudomonadota bacterium]MBV1737425.1 VWA domain-containing protein [Desulfarculus sp.]
MARKILFCLSLVLAVLLAAPWAAMAAGERKPVRIQGTKAMYLRVVARPFAKIYKEPKEGAEVVDANVRTFQPFYVYTQPKQAQSVTQTKEEGWYEVGPNDRGQVSGWIKAGDVMLWKHAMCLLYTSPKGRKPVLMFSGIKSLQEMVKKPQEQRLSEAGGFYKAIAEAGNKELPKDFPVVAMEPKRWVDPRTQFYLMPVLEAVNLEVDSFYATLVKMAAATAAGRGSSNVRTNVEARKEALVSAESGDAVQKIKEQKIDVVYVMDMTKSMGPFIEDTLKTILDTSAALSQKMAGGQDLGSNLHFGLWGYRDSETIQGIEFNTRNFTPELQGVESFGKTLSTVREARVGSEGFEEDMFGGVDQAILNTKWTGDALRFIVLIGDAPSHPLGHKWNSSKKDGKLLRELANGKKVYLFAMHIQYPDARLRSYHEAGEVQFSALAVNPGTDGPAFFKIKGDDRQDFTRVSKLVAESMVAALQKGQQGVVMAGAAPAAGAAPTASAPTAQTGAPSGGTNATQAAQIAEVIRAAQVQWLGKATGAQAPKDITAFAMDRDLENPAIPSMDVCVLLNKRQLDSLVKTLQTIIEAGRRGQKSGQGFFKALKEVAVVSGADPDKILNAKKYGESGLVPEFLAGLPYKSKVMALTGETWASWNSMEQDEFMNELDGKIQAYQDIHEQADQWVQLNKGDDKDQYVYPVKLSLMP